MRSPATAPALSPPCWLSAPLRATSCSSKCVQPPPTPPSLIRIFIVILIGAIQINTVNAGQGTFNSMSSPPFVLLVHIPVSRSCPLTRLAVMMPRFIVQYATAKLGAPATQGKSDADVLALVTPDEHNFGSISWFLSTQCSTSVQQAVAAGTDAGWAAYMGCLGVSAADPARLAYWSAAKKAFQLSG